MPKAKCDTIIRGQDIRLIFFSVIFCALLFFVVSKNANFHTHAMGGGREFKIQCDVITYYVQLLLFLLLLLPLSAEFYGPRLNALKMKLKSKKRAEKEGRKTENLVTFVWDFEDFFLFFSELAVWCFI